MAMFDDTLHFLANHLESPDFRRLGEHWPFEWIEQAVQSTEAASIRRRRLPAEQVVWLMVALALYRHKSISEVLDDLGLALPDAQAPFVSKSAAAQTRQRLGADPLKWFFEHAAQHWTRQDRRCYLFKGLQLFAMDGTTLRTHDTNETGHTSAPRSTQLRWRAILRCVALHSQRFPPTLFIAPPLAHMGPMRCSTPSSSSAISPMRR